MKEKSDTYKNSAALISLQSIFGGGVLKDECFLLLWLFVYFLSSTTIPQNSTEHAEEYIKYNGEEREGRPTNFGYVL